MREFSWRYFTLTGDIDAYLLFKQHEEVLTETEEVDLEASEPDGIPE